MKIRPASHEGRIGEQSTRQAPAFTRTLIFNVVGLVMVLELTLLTAMVWQGITDTEAAARSNAKETLDRSTERLEILIRAAQMTGDSAEHAAHGAALTGASLRSTLEHSLSAFEQRPELSYVGIVLPETGEYGNLERTAKGDILLWLFPGKRAHDAVTRSFNLTRQGFVLHEEKFAYDYDPRSRPFYQAAVSAPGSGRWIPTYQWIVHNTPGQSLWGFSYVKALHDDSGRLIGVLDTDFDMPALNRFIRSLNTEYHCLIQVVELGSTARLIGDAKVDLAPLPVPDDLVSLLKFDGDVWLNKIKVNGEHRWVAARRLNLQGGRSWMVVTTQPAPLIDPALQRQLYHVGEMGLVIALGLILISIRLGQRFGRPLAKLEQRVAAIGLDELVDQPEKTNDTRTEFREIQLLNVAVDNMATVVHQLFESKEQVTATNEQLELRVALRTNELAKAQHELMNAEKMASLGAMVAGISHELNTPISNTLLAASTMEHLIEGLDQKAQNKSLSVSALSEFLVTGKELSTLITRSTKRAVTLIESFKQVAIDQTSERRRHFDLKDVIDDNAASLFPKLKATGIKLENLVAPGIACDSFPGPLGQILINLIDNAILHGLQESKSGIIRIVAEQLGNQVILTVKDNGIGMTPHVLAHVFDPFFTTKLGKGGSGLGMSISYQIATSVLGGELVARSILGEGATFILSFPKVAPFTV
ncbi:signal transduction histidine kinase [Oxalobacteraceae bacterium GrIS 2.11]